MSRKAKFLTFACLFFLTFFCSFIGTSYHFHHLMFREVRSASATVFNVTPASHAAVYYRYAVDDLTFEGVGSSTNYKIGDQAGILYAIDEPKDSELQENIPTAQGMIGFTFFGSLFASLLGTAVMSLGTSTASKAARLAS